MSWEVPEGRHYLADPPRWWYWERWAVQAGEAGQTKLTQGNYMSQYETGYGASGSDGGGRGGTAVSAPAVSATAVSATAGLAATATATVNTSASATASAAGYEGRHGATPVV